CSHQSATCMLTLCARCLLLVEPCIARFYFFYFNDTATTEIYTLSLHDALPISLRIRVVFALIPVSYDFKVATKISSSVSDSVERSEEHTSELQSRSDLVCRLLLEKKKNFSRWLQMRIRTNIIPAGFRRYSLYRH